MYAHIHSIKTNAHTVRTFLHIGSHQTKLIYAFYNRQAADKIKQKNMMGRALVRKRCMNPILDNQIQWIDK